MPRPSGLKYKRHKPLAGVTLTCPCGKDFYCEPSRVSRTRCCSKACQYAYARRPSGLNYDIVADNRGWFTADRMQGNIPANKGKKYELPQCKGRRNSPSTEFKRGQVPHNFKGTEVGYHALHSWVRRHFGIPLKCEQCGSEVNLRWASKDWEYTRERSSWWPLCQRCHTVYDMQNAWGVASEMYPEIRR
jgi:hypothetical protein